MAKEKSKERQLKRLYNQLSKVQNQKSTKPSEKLKRETPTKRGRIENSIKTIENTSKK